MLVYLGRVWLSGTHAEVRGRLWGVGSLPPCGSWGLSSGHQARYDSKHLYLLNHLTSPVKANKQTNNKHFKALYGVRSWEFSLSLKINCLMFVSSVDYSKSKTSNIISSWEEEAKLCTDCPVEKGNLNRQTRTLFVPCFASLCVSSTRRKDRL